MALYGGLERVSENEVGENIFVIVYIYVLCLIQISHRNALLVSEKRKFLADIQ